MNKFCIGRGTNHQTGCVHTSQQNGIVERKHYHLLDVAQTPMFNMYVPKQYWVDVVLIAFYLINHISSFVLNNRFPSLSYIRTSPFFLHPQVFGWVAFVHNLEPNRDK